MSAKDERVLQDICLHIVNSLCKALAWWGSTVKAPNQEFCFLKTLKCYERIDKSISKAALAKFSGQLSEKIIILSFFDNEVFVKNIMNVVDLQRENLEFFELVFCLFLHYTLVYRFWHLLFFIDFVSIKRKVPAIFQQSKHIMANKILCVQSRSQKLTDPRIPLGAACLHVDSNKSYKSNAYP